MIYEKIDLISEMLDATLNLKCFCIKGLNDDLSFIKELMLPIFVDNNKEKDKFRDMLFNMEEEHVYLLDNLILGNYIVICLNKIEQNYLFVSPYLSENKYEDLLNYTDEYNISNNDIEFIHRYYNTLPFINKSKITSIISVIKNNIYDKDIDLKFIFKKKFKKNERVHLHSNKITTDLLDYKYVEDCIRLDKRLVHTVSSGSKVNSLKVLDKILDLYFVEEEAYNIRMHQNKLIYYNTLLLVMLKDKDVSNIYAASLFKRYMKKIESARFDKDIKDIFYDMVMDYCFAISEFNIKHHSSLVGKVVDHINSNLQDNLSVNEIANRFYVSPTYLSRIFKKETGFSVIEYINKLKIKHSTFLLRDTALPIQDISRIIGINDVNYFCRIFKKYMNQTPTQYRKIFK